MPYTIKKDDEGRFCVLKKGPDGEAAGEPLACHDTEEQAVAQIGAIESNEGEHAAPVTHVRMLRAYADREGMSSEAGTPMRFIASTSEPARDGGIIDQDGWVLEPYRANPVVLWAHAYDSLPLGRAEVEVRDGKLMAEVVWDQADDLARQVESKYRRGFLNAVSVGWHTIEYADRRSLPDGVAWKSLKHELQDISAVPVPADAGALVERQRSLMREWARSMLTDETTQPAPTPEEPVWSDVAAAMVAVFARAGDDPEEARLEHYNALLPKYRKLGKVAPEWLDAADVTALGPAEKRGLFLAGEMDLCPDAFPDPPTPPVVDDGQVEAALTRILSRLSAPSAQPSRVDASLRGLLARIGALQSRVATVAELPATPQAPATTPAPESPEAQRAAGGDDGEGSEHPDSEADTVSILSRLRERLESTQWTSNPSSRTSTTA